MKEAMPNSNVKKRSLPQWIRSLRGKSAETLPLRTTWKSVWGQAGVRVRESLVRSPLMTIPFGLSVLVFILSLGFLSPWLFPSANLQLPGKTFALPVDSILPLALSNTNTLDQFLAPPVDATDDVQGIIGTPPLSVSTYVLQSGDALSVIAARYNLDLGTLISFNNVKNVRHLGVGAKLQIPNSNGLLYTVSAGDSLSSICRTQHVDYGEVMEVNRLSTPVLTPGQKLFLPGVSMSRWDLRQASGELFIFPVRGVITSRFGYRRDPFNGIRSFHNGVDLANRFGTPVHASMEGVVVDRGYSSTYGNYIRIRHEGGFETLYGHLKAFKVKIGQGVNQGQLIGEMGSTGYSTGSHTHFSIFKWGTAVNPLNYLF